MYRKAAAAAATGGVGQRLVVDVPDETVKPRLGRE